MFLIYKITYFVIIEGILDILLLILSPSSLIKFKKTNFTIFCLHSIHLGYFIKVAAFSFKENFDDKITYLPIVIVTKY